MLELQPEEALQSALEEFKLQVQTLLLWICARYKLANQSCKHSCAECLVRLAGSGPQQHCHRLSRRQTSYVRAVNHVYLSAEHASRIEFSGHYKYCCRDVMKKAVEALKVASQPSGTQTSSPSVLESISHVQDQIQSASPESLPSILEGTTCPHCQCIHIYPTVNQAVSH